MPGGAVNILQGAHRPPSERPPPPARTGRDGAAGTALARHSPLPPSPSPSFGTIQPPAFRRGRLAAACWVAIRLGCLLPSASAALLGSASRGPPSAGRLDFALPPTSGQTKSRRFSPAAKSRAYRLVRGLYAPQNSPNTTAPTSAKAASMAIMFSLWVTSMGGLLWLVNARLKLPPFLPFRKQCLLLRCNIYQ